MNEDKYWHGLEPIQIGPYRIESPLTYVRDKISPFSDPSCITCDLEVDLNGIPSEPLGYYPNYAQLAPAQRNYYLQWMSGGREVFPNEQGYVFIFYYGLERRALEENSDIGIIVSEVIRLRKLHALTTPKFSSFLGYSESFVWYLLAKYPHVWNDALIQKLGLDNVQGSKLATVIHWAGVHYNFLPDWLAFSIGLANYPRKDDYFKIRKKDAFPVFQKKYFERWPQGINLHPTPSGTTIIHQIDCYTASTELSSFFTEISLSQKVPRELSSLNQVCSDSLRETPHPLKSTISQIVGNVTPENKYFLLKISGVANLMKLPVRNRYTPSQSKKIADLLEDCGYSIEPDSRSVDRSYGYDEAVVVFQLYECPTNIYRYRTAISMLRLGLVVASADNSPEGEQLKLLAKQILDLFQLTKPEQRRIAALANLWIATGVNLKNMSRTFAAHLTKVQRGMIGKFLIAIATHDGVLTRGEMKALQSVFKRLELDAKVLDKFIKELRSQNNITIIKQSEKPSRGEKIPKPIKESVVVQLDPDLIKELLRDTREVQQVLAEAMNLEANEAKLPVANGNGHKESPFEEVQSQNVSSQISQVTRTTPSKHLVRFYERLIEKDDWPILEISSLAKEYGHMYNGAIEEINDWATEYMGGTLLYEDGDRLIVERELLYT